MYTEKEFDTVVEGLKKVKPDVWMDIKPERTNPNKEALIEIVKVLINQGYPLAINKDWTAFKFDKETADLLYRLIYHSDTQYSIKNHAY